MRLLLSLGAAVATLVGLVTTFVVSNPSAPRLTRNPLTIHTGRQMPPSSREDHRTHCSERVHDNHRCRTRERTNSRGLFPRSNLSLAAGNNGTWQRYITYYWDGKESHHVLYRRAHADDLGRENDGSFHHYRAQDSERVTALHDELGFHGLLDKGGGSGVRGCDGLLMEERVSISSIFL